MCEIEDMQKSFAYVIWLILFYPFTLIQITSDKS